MLGGGHVDWKQPVVEAAVTGCLTHWLRLAAMLITWCVIAIHLHCALQLANTVLTQHSGAVSIALLKGSAAAGQCNILDNTCSTTPQHCWKSPQHRSSTRGQGGTGGNGESVRKLAKPVTRQSWQSLALQ